MRTLRRPQPLLARSSSTRRRRRRLYGFRRFIEQQGFHSLYLVASEGSAIKVGIAKNPNSRFSELQTANYLPLRLHRYWWLPGREMSERVERAFKQQFAAHNIRGEWFDMPLPEAEAFIELMIRNLGTWGISEAEMVQLMDQLERRRRALPDEAPSPLNPITRRRR